jgi:hypothetical protein
VRFACSGEAEHDGERQRDGGKDASPATRRARFTATYHPCTITSGSWENVCRGDVDHDEPCARDTEELEHH